MIRLILPNVMDFFPWPKTDANKHSRGRLAVFAGAELQTGAARLAAINGARIGAGWTKIFANHNAAQIIATQITSIMVGAYEHGEKLPAELSGYDAIIIGPAFGLGVLEQGTLGRVLGLEAALVLDADALSLLSQDTKNAFAIIKSRPSPTILTPHSGEFSRLFEVKVSKQLQPRIDETRFAAKKSGAIIVHKGAQTIICAPQGETWVLEHSTPWLATAGTGDCLAGLIGGLLAQGVEAVHACQMAVYLHAEIGKHIGAGLIADDMAQHIGAVLNKYAPDNLKS